MSEFKKVSKATFNPTVCALCGTFEGPFIDTNWDTPVYGHVYICTSSPTRAGCLTQMARLDNILPLEDMELENRVLEEQNRVLRESLHEVGRIIRAYLAPIVFSDEYEREQILG